MNEAKFTKGPWGVTHFANGQMRVYRIGRTCHEPDIANTHGDNDVSNAHLIAAAPEMYAMLEDLRERIGLLDEEALGFVDDTPDQQGWFIREEILYNIDQLLSKARGEK